MTYLTEKQRDVLAFIRSKLTADGVAPTLQEIAAEFGFRSTASAQKHVGLLEKKGFIRREKHQKRGLVLTTGSRQRAGDGQIPLLGVVAAGSPIESIPDPEQFTVPTDLLRSGDHYVLQVRGDSMIDEGIRDGDYVVVQSTPDVSDGDVVVALFDDEVTLKQLYRHDECTYRLQPANFTLPPIYVPAERLRVQGVVVGLIRRY
jgi:repressor LexA